MPRGPRFDAPGVIHHVTFRGIERREIFADDEDREVLLSILDRLALTMLFRVFAWALMPNHVHLVVQADGALPRLMSRLLTSYGLYFNRRHARAGHVFQNRYWSRPIDEDLETVASYVHRNPVRAGLATEAGLDRYPWCGRATAVGGRGPRLFEGDPRVCPERVAPALAAIVEDECARLQLSVAAVLGGARTRAHSAARRRIVMRALRETGHPLAEIGGALTLSPSAVSQIARRIGDGEPRGVSSTNVPGVW